MSTSLGHLVTYLTANTAQLEEGLTKAQIRMKAFGTAMKATGKVLTMSLTAPLIAVGVVSGKISKDFEANMSKIVGLVGVAKEQTNAWGKQILDLAPAVGQGPVKLADALFFITSAGIKGADAMDVLDKSAKAASAGLGDAATVADLVTSAMNAYGSDVLNASQATDILVATVREGKAAPEELAAALGQVLPIASNMGITFDQVGASIAAMTRTGTNASTAAMQLKQILASLLKPSSMAETAMNKMGTSSAHFRKVLKEKGLIAALSELKVLQKKYGDQTMANVFPNIRALSGVLDLVGGNAKANIKIFNNLTDTTGSLDKAFKEASQTTEFKWNAAVAGMQSGLKSVGDVMIQIFIPIMQSLGRLLKNIGDWFANLSDRGKSFAKVAIIILGAIGPVTLILGFIVANIIPKLITGFKAARTAILFMNKALMANPWMALAAGVVLAVSALSAYLVKSKQVKSPQLDLSQGIADTNKAISTQVGAMNLLFTQLKKTNPGTLQRAGLIEEINKKYGDYLPNLLTEKSTLEDISTAQVQANNGLVQSIVLKAKQTELEKLYGTETAKQMKIIRTEMKSVSADNRKKLADLAQQLSLLDKSSATYQSLRNSIRGVAGIYGTTAESVVRLSDTFRNQRKGLAQIENDYGAIEKALLKVGKAGKAAGGGGGGGSTPTPSRTPNSLVSMPSIAAKPLEVGTSGVAETINKDADDAEVAGNHFVGVLNAMYAKSKNAAEQFNKSFGELARQGIADFAGAIGEGVGNLATGGSSMADVMSGILGLVADFGKKLGGMMISVGVAQLALDTALESMNPYVAIAGGIALIAAATIAKNYITGGIQGMATGGMVTKGGQFLVGEKGPELATLPAGTAVTPNHMLSGLPMPSQTNNIGDLTTKISGQDLLVILNRANSSDKRF